MPTTQAAPVLTVNQPAANTVVGLNPFQVRGQVTDRGMPEPILIDSVTVQVDGGPLINATLKHIPNKTLVQFTFSAMAQISGGNDPHTVTIVATNDQGQRATKTVTVFTGQPFQTDVPAVLLDIRALFSITANDPQVLGLIGTVQKQLLSLSANLATAGKVLIGPNLVTQPVTGTAETRIRVGFWIEDPSFPVVPPSAAFPLPRLSDAAAAASFALVPFLDAPNPIQFPTFGVSIPTTTLQHLVDANTPQIKAEAAQKGLTIESIAIQTTSPAAVITLVHGHITAGIPASITINETVGLNPPPFGAPTQMVPAVVKTDPSSSIGSLLDWLIGSLIPFLGGVLVYAAFKVSSVASTETGVAGGFLNIIPSRIPFGNKAITLPPSQNFTMPDFPVLVFFWNSFAATSTGLVGAGTAEIDPRDQSMVQLLVHGPDFFSGLADDIIEKTDPTMSYILVNFVPDAGKFGWQITGAGKNSDTLDPPSPIVEAGDFSTHFPLPLHPSVGDYNFKLTVDAVETCQSDATKTLTGTGSKSVKFQVKKGATGV